MERTIISGGVVEKSKFFVPSNTKPRSPRAQKTRSRKRDLNWRNAIKRLARILNCNFSSGDVLMTLTVDAEHEHLLDELGHEGTKFLRRLKRALRNPDLKWILVVAERDSSTGERKRAHLHLVISGTGLRFEDKCWYAGSRKLREVWGLGAVNVKNLYDEPDYTGLARYLCGQAACKEYEEKWHSSRNMEKPVVKESLTPVPGRIRIPKGVRLLYDGEWVAENGSHYIRYTTQRKKKAAAGRKKHERGKGVRT